MWEVKTGGELKNPGSQWPDTSTIQYGADQVAWYVGRQNYRQHKSNLFQRDWVVGDQWNDGIVKASIEECGGTCRVNFGDKLTLDIKNKWEKFLNFSRDKKRNLICLICKE